MRVIECRVLEGPGSLQYADWAIPKPAPGQVVIKVSAAGINFADTLMTRGKYQQKPALPFVPGLELAGTIAALGEGVSGLEAGQRVMAFVDSGAFAEYAVAKASDVIALPDSMPAATAAGFGITFGTAIAALDWRAAMQPGETLLVHGAGGGVGAAAVAVGRAMGAEVTATARGEAKLAIAKEAGAGSTFDIETPDLVNVLRAHNPKRFDVVYDPVGGFAFDCSLKCIAWEGRIVIIGFASGDVPQVPANHLLVKNAAVLGLYWGSYREHDPARLRDSFSKLFDWHANGLLGDIAPEEVAFEDGIDAINRLAERRTSGKLVISLSE